MDRELIRTAMQSVSQEQENSLGVCLTGCNDSTPSLLIGEQPTKEEVQEAMMTLSIVFPRMKPEFWSVLASRIRANGKSKAWLEYAVTEVIDHHSFATLTIADILGIDKRAKIYSYDEACYDGENFILTTIGWISKQDYLAAPMLFTPKNEVNAAKAERWKVQQK